jgi:restriction endonuclease S subunit
MIANFIWSVADDVLAHIDSFMSDGKYLMWTTDNVHAGTMFRSNSKLSYTNVCGPLRPRGQLDLDFMRMAVTSETERVVYLDINIMARIHVSVPPFDEQVQIAHQVKQVIEPSELAINRTRRKIELLREYRTRLISDVVTGKLDVREAAANLPSEPNESEPLDKGDALVEEGGAPANDRDSTSMEVSDATN